MAGIDEVLERLVADGDFRAALARDPAAALAAYDLTREDVELLATRLDDGDDAERAVEQRTSKSAMLAMLSSLSFGGGAGDDALAEVKAKSWSWGEAQGDAAAPDDLAAPDDEALQWELENAQITSYQTGGSGGDVVPDGVAPDDLTAPVDAPVDDGELYYKAGEVEIESWSWGETNDGGGSASDDLTHKVAPDEEQSEYTFNYAKIHIEPSADEPTLPTGPSGAVPPDDSVVGGVPPDDSVAGVNPPDDGVVGGIPPDDGVAGANPPDDGVVGATPRGSGPGHDAEQQGIIVINGQEDEPSGVPSAEAVQGGPIMEVEGHDVAPSGAIGDADEQGIIVVDTKPGQLGALNEALADEVLEIEDV